MYIHIFIYVSVMLDYEFERVWSGKIASAVSFRSFLNHRRSSFECPVSSSQYKNIDEIAFPTQATQGEHFIAAIQNPRNAEFVSDF